MCLKKIFGLGRMTSGWGKLMQHWDTLTQTIDVAKIIPQMTPSVKFSAFDFEELMSKEGHQERALALLEMVTDRGPLAYMAFRDALAKSYPNLYLLLTDEDQDDQIQRCELDYNSPDAWDPLREWRHLLLTELKASEVVPKLVTEGVLTPKEAAEVNEARENEQTEVLLDILETLDPLLIDPFLDVIADNYPHVYLTLTGFENDLDDL